MRRPAAILTVVVMAGVLSTAPPAEAALAAKANLATNSTGATKAVVKLTSSRPVTSKNKPTSVTLVAGDTNFPLRLKTSQTATNLGTWKSSSFTGEKQLTLFAAALGKVTIKVGSKAGTSQFRTALNSPDIDGGAGIEIMTALFRGGAAWLDYSSSGSESYELHLCSDGWTRFRTGVTSEFGAFATEKFGQPWSVSEGFIDPDTGLFGAVIDVVFTIQNDSGEGASEINEHWQTVIQYYQEQWLWEQEPAQLIQPSCDPSF